MRHSTLGVLGILLLSAQGAVAGNVDAKLLDILLANGSITKAQHAELSADLESEKREQQAASGDKVSAEEFAAFRQKAGWAATTTLKGDMRVRHETIDVSGEPDFSGSRNKERQRIRARIGAFTQVNPQVEMGIQVASGSSADRRSTNDNLDNYFDRKPIWIDLAYVDFHPAAAPGLKTVAGKMKQQWTSMGDMIWDSDINPEGLSAAYTAKTGSMTWFGSGGYFVVKDAVDAEGFELSHDLALYQAQLGTAFELGDALRLTLGTSIYDFNNDKYGSTSSFRTNGNTTDRFSLLELFGQVDVNGLPLPLSLYGQYVQNRDARDLGAVQGASEDTGLMLGLRTSVSGLAIDYSYRDVEANAVVGGFTDSDFALGYTDASGHRLKLKYELLKNFSIGATWIMADSDAVSSQGLDDVDADTFHVDLEAKF
jgi:hypothetical protein